MSLPDPTTFFLGIAILTGVYILVVLVMVGFQEAKRDPFWFLTLWFDTTEHLGTTVWLALSIIGILIIIGIVMGSLMPLFRT